MRCYCGLTIILGANNKITVLIVLMSLILDKYVKTYRQLLIKPLIVNVIDTVSLSAIFTNVYCIYILKCHCALTEGGVATLPLCSCSH